MRWLGPLTISTAPVPYHPSTGSRSPLSLVPRPPWPCHIKRLVPLATAEVVASHSTAACRPLARPRPATSPLPPRRRRRLPPSQIVPSSPTKVPDRTINIITALALLPPHPSPCLVLTAVSCRRVAALVSFVYHHFSALSFVLIIILVLFPLYP